MLARHALLGQPLLEDAELALAVEALDRGVLARVDEDGGDRDLGHEAAVDDRRDDVTLGHEGVVEVKLGVLAVLEPPGAHDGVRERLVGVGAVQVPELLLALRLVVHDVAEDVGELVPERIRPRHGARGDDDEPLNTVLDASPGDVLDTDTVNLFGIPALGGSRRREDDGTSVLESTLERLGLGHVDARHNVNIVHRDLGRSKVLRSEVAARAGAHAVPPLCDQRDGAELARLAVGPDDHDGAVGAPEPLLLLGERGERGEDACGERPAEEPPPADAALLLLHAEV
mmetsp:Transcript_12595/g.31665  ORF Transcript_12595/g.31665 Transcript_12595/m.31665 type:complete len:286 (+) Transcript_12595:371-1228(+)